jgi:hypothetical protein
LANGDITQSVRGVQVTSHLVFHFTDGSLHDETTIFSQRDRFELVSDHVVQKGPAFPRQLDMTIDMETSRVTVRYQDKGATETTKSERLALPSDVANGMMPVVMKNVTSQNLPTLSYVVATPAPRVVKLVLSLAGVDALSVAGMTRRATHYIIKADIGGLAGILAPLVGRQPPDSHIWILTDPTPGFVKSRGPLYVGGPSWDIELISRP